MTENPLWFVFIISSIASAFLSMDIGVSHESNTKSPKRKLIISMVITGFVSTAIGIFVPFTSKVDSINGFFVGGIFFICFLIPNIYTYYLRIKQQD